MSGDLGNLLTGELGEAEARFSHEDFAADFGQRIAGRVRRRRAVRAAGVGGGTMLTAGALAVGAMNIPWGVLGVAPGGSGSDCVTASPSDGANLVTVSFDGSDGRLAETVVTDSSTGGVRLRGIQQADGTWVVTDADGNPVEATPGPGGGYVVQLSDATAGVLFPMPSTSASPSDPTMTGTFSYTVEAPAGGASPSASDDCYTPSPTPSGDPNMANGISQGPDPSLAAKPEDIVGSPFECGFEFPTESYGNDTQSFDDIEWVSPDEMNAQIRALHPDSGSDIYQAVGQDDVPVITLSDDFASSFGEWTTGGSDAVDPALALGERDPDAMPSGVRVMHGSSFVAVADGVVVGTITEPFVPNTAPPIYQRVPHGEFGETLALLNADNAFTACPGATLDGNWDLYAVAGDIARESDGRVYGPDYFWLKATRP